MVRLSRNPSANGETARPATGAPDPVPTLPDGAPGPTTRPANDSGEAGALKPQVIDISALIGDGTGRDRRSEIIAEIESACADQGLFVLAGHGVDAELSTAFDAARAFFGLHDYVKDRVPRINRYGYVPDRIEARTPSSTAYLGRSSLVAEYLDMGLADEVDLDAIEALGCGGFTAAVRGYQAAALGAARAVLEALATTLGVPGFFAARMAEPQCRLRFLHYPPSSPLEDGSAPVFSTPHTDYGAITLLATDGVPGLELLQNSRWVPVSAPPGGIIVQLGDMLARWTNDRYRSTPHRVVGASGTDRYSIPFFVNPDPSVVVSTIDSCVTVERPERYEPVTAGEFLVSRIDSPAEPYV